MSTKVLANGEERAPLLEVYSVGEVFCACRCVKLVITYEAVHDVLALMFGDPLRFQTMFSRQSVEEIWVVGSGTCKRLNMLTLNLAHTSFTFIRKNYSVELERTVRELNGDSCIKMQNAPHLNSK